jgi:DNA-binding FadR family transcriptional regulator
MRELVEPAAASRAAERATDDEIARIGLAMAGIEGNDRGTDAQIKADVAFHMGILESTHNPILRSLGALIESALAISFSMSWRAVMRADAVFQHRQIYEAIRDRRADDAFMAMRKLLRNSKGDVFDAIWANRNDPRQKG